MTRVPDEADKRALTEKLEHTQPGQPVTFTDREIKVLRGLARVLLGVPVIFGSFRQIALFITAIAGTVVIANTAAGIVGAWLAAGGGP